jgi:cytochrome P450
LFVTQLQWLVSQVSSRVFLGVPLCRDENWIRIAKNYTMELMQATYAMQYIPRPMRPFIWRFLPQLSTLQKSYAAARAIIDPEVQRRGAIAAQAINRGEKLPKHLDAVDWMIEIAAQYPRKYDITAGQLSLTFAAIHTTSTTATHLMYDIIEQSLIDDLRQEIINVYKEDKGWSKNSLYKLKLLDSVMKESQRINCLSAGKHI